MWFQLGERSADVDVVRHRRSVGEPQRAVCTPDTPGRGPQTILESLVPQ